MPRALRPNYTYPCRRDSRLPRLARNVSLHLQVYARQRAPTFLTPNVLTDIVSYFVIDYALKCRNIHKRICFIFTESLDERENVMKKHILA